jgi:putative NADPH-quinone reductase
LEHRVLAIAGSPRRGGNSEKLLDSALAGVAAAAPGAAVTKIVLNELKFAPCQNCGFCNATGDCRFASDDDMRGIYEALDASDRFVIASPIYFASISAQLKTMIDRCQALWARKYLLKRPHANPDRKALFLCCGGFKHDRFYQCARQVIAAWCVVLDIRLTGELFFHSIDARGDIEKHPTALADALAAGREMMK